MTGRQWVKAGADRRGRVVRHGTTRGRGGSRGAPSPCQSRQCRLGDRDDDPARRSRAVRRPVCPAVSPRAPAPLCTRGPSLLSPRGDPLCNNAAAEGFGGPGSSSRDLTALLLRLTLPERAVAWTSIRGAINSPRRESLGPTE